MQRQFDRWFRSEEEENRLLQVQSSQYRQKRSVGELDLDTSSSLDDSSTLDNTMSGNEEERELSPREVMNFLRRIDGNIEKLTTTVDEVRGEIHTVRVENDKLKQVVDELKSENEFLHTKVNELEYKIDLALKQSHHNHQYSRRNNLRFFGVKELEGENFFNTITDIVQNKLHIKDFSTNEIDAAHRLGVKDSNQRDPKPRAIIVRCVRRTMRDRIIKSRKTLAKSRMSITEDLTKENMQLMNAAKKHEAVESAWSSEGRVMVCMKESKKITSIKSMQHLNQNAQVWIRWVKPKNKDGEKKDNKTDSKNEVPGLEAETQMQTEQATGGEGEGMRMQTEPGVEVSG